MFAALCRSEAFAIILHKCIHTQTSKCFVRCFFKKLNCYLFSDSLERFALVLSRKNHKILAFLFLYYYPFQRKTIFWHFSM